VIPLTGTVFLNDLYRRAYADGRMHLVETTVIAALAGGLSRVRLDEWGVLKLGSVNEGLLAAVERNRHYLDDFSLLELGSVFLPKGIEGCKQDTEYKHLALAESWVHQTVAYRQDLVPELLNLRSLTERAIERLGEPADLQRAFEQRIGRVDVQMHKAGAGVGRAPTFF